MPSQLPLVSDEVGGFGNATLADEVDAVPDRDAVAGCAFAAERAACRRFLRRFALFHFTLARCTARDEMCLIATASREHALVGGEVEAIDDGRCGLAQTLRLLSRPILCTIPTSRRGGCHGSFAFGFAVASPARRRRMYTGGLAPSSLGRAKAANRSSQKLNVAFQPRCCLNEAPRPACAERAGTT